MNPQDVYSPNQQPGGPGAPPQGQPNYGGPLAPGPQYGGGGQPNQSPNQSPGIKKSKSRKGLIIAITEGAIIFLLLVVLVVVVSNNKSPSTQNKAQTNSAATSAIEPAQSIEVEQTNNSLSQDLSGLDDEKDLPAKSLDDSTLGL